MSVTERSATKYQAVFAGSETTKPAVEGQVLNFSTRADGDYFFFFVAFFFAAFLVVFFAAFFVAFLAAAFRTTFFAFFFAGMV